MTDWTTEKTWIWTAEEAGSYRVEVQVRDEKHAGPNGSDDKWSDSFSVALNSPPVINGFGILSNWTYTTPPEGVNESCHMTGGAGTVDAVAFDPDGDQVLYRFFLDDEPVTEWTTDNTWTWSPNEVGTYHFLVQVRDGKHAGPNEMDDSISYKVEILSID